MKRLAMIITAVVCAQFIHNEAMADVYKNYGPNNAVAYATANYATAYGSGSGQNPFGNYANQGGNCTNFVSQCIIAGLAYTSIMSIAFNARYDYDIDATGGSIRWYWISDTSRGSAFLGAQQLYEYARDNSSSYSGLHFQYVTNDTPTDTLNVDAVQPGDIIFADWQANGSKDHSMIVTAKDWWRIGYDKIRLTYQGSPGVVGVTNQGLGEIDARYYGVPIFIVYRPVNYNPSGI